MLRPRIYARPQECREEHWLLTWPSEHHISDSAPLPHYYSGMAHPCHCWLLIRKHSDLLQMFLLLDALYLLNTWMTCHDDNSLMTNLFPVLTGILWNGKHDEAGVSQAHCPPPWSLRPWCRKWVQRMSLEAACLSSGLGRDRAAVQFSASSMGGDGVSSCCLLIFSVQTEVELEQQGSCKVLSANKFPLPMLSLSKCLTGWFLEVGIPEW